METGIILLFSNGKMIFGLVSGTENTKKVGMYLQGLRLGLKKAKFTDIDLSYSPLTVIRKEEENVIFPSCR